MKTPEERWLGDISAYASSEDAKNGFWKTNKESVLDALRAAEREARAEERERCCQTIMCAPIPQAFFGSPSYALARLGLTDAIRGAAEISPPAAPSLEKRVEELTEVCEQQEHKIDELQRWASGFTIRLGKIEEWKAS